MRFITTTLLSLLVSLQVMAGKVIKNPVIEYSASWMEITEIELTKEATIVRGVLRQGSSILNNTVLADRNTGKEFKFLRVIDYKKFVENSRKWLEDYINSNHLQSLVIGISGGIDSTVSCAIASPVCKKLNIPLIGRSLPSESNAPQENNSAQLVGEAFCNDFKIVSISNTFKSVHKLCYEGECLNHSKVINNISNLQDGNIKARLRMIYLRNLASMHGGVVLDNDNFTEWELGFWTVGGDSPMDINLGLHYLWKTEVYELAEYLYEELAKQATYGYDEFAGKYMKQAESIYKSMKLVPTDGNGVMSGGDCAQFGLDNYSQVDDVLKTMYFSNIEDETEKANEYIRLIDSYNEQGVDSVMIRHQNSTFKRLPQPIYPSKEELGL